MDKPPWADRFMDKVDVRGENDCWEWKASTFSNGYGQFHIRGKNGFRKNHLAHRLSLEYLGRKTIPNGMLVLHSCDNRKCVNPNHLSIGDQSENLRQAFQRGRHSLPIKIGEDANQSVLKESDVLKIIESKGKELQKETARRFGISQPQVSAIQRGASWKHITR